jgi:transcriptional regulator with XRE-family HTH domain
LRYDRCMARTKGWTGKLGAFGLYLQRNNVKREAIATGSGVTPSYISMLAHEKARPGFRLALAIERWTLANVVTPAGLEGAGKPAPFRCGDWITPEPAPAAAPPAAA